MNRLLLKVSSSWKDTDIGLPSLDEDSTEYNEDSIERENDALQQQVDTLQKTLSVLVEDGKLLKQRYVELQKTVDTMMTENKALKTQLNEISTTSGDEGLIIKKHENGKQEIKGGLKDKLIEMLYNQDQLLVSDYVDTFLVTFRSFTTSEYVWEFLMNKYPNKLSYFQFSLTFIFMQYIMLQKIQIHEKIDGP